MAAVKQQLPFLVAEINALFVWNAVLDGFQDFLVHFTVITESM